ncbi:hypothetical protein PC120_g3678 [Phytophthora cactorum]|nr:hypothetical protein PC120_g3678 [Phytophthora cactorum]
MGKRSVSELARYAILHDLLKRNIDGELAYGAQKATAATFGVHRQTVGSIWNLYNASVAAGNVTGDIKCKYKGNSGRKGYNKRLMKQKLEAVPAHQRWDLHRKTEFDGKIGLWPLTEDYVAQRSSKNRPAGTILKPNIKAVNAEVSKHFLLEFVFAAIRAKWPRGDSGKIIYVQQDNATPHIQLNDPDVLREGSRDGWYIRLIFQPPNLPDLHCLDFSYFPATQTLQYKTYVSTTELLIDDVEASFRNLDRRKLDNIFLTQQQVMGCILACEGGNVYILPHLGKAKLRRQEKLLRYVVCDADVVKEAGGQPL